MSEKEDLYSHVTLLYGSDAYVMEARVRQLVDKLLPAGRDDFNIEEMDGSTLTINDVLMLVESQPFLSERKVYVIRQPSFLLPAGKQKPAASKKPSEVQQTFIRYADNPNPLCPLILTVQSDAKPTGFLKELIKHCKAIPCEPLQGNELYQWLDQLAREFGKTWHASAKHAFQEIQPFVTTAQLMQEAEKALLYSDKKDVQAQAVHQVLSPSPQYSIFNLVDAVLDGQTEKALSAWKDCFYMGENAGKVIYMVGDALRRILVIQSLHHRGQNVNEIQRMVERPAFVVRKNIKQGERLHTNRVVAALDLLLEKDYQRKTIPGIQEALFVEELLVLLIDCLHHQGNDRGNRG